MYLSGWNKQPVNVEVSDNYETVAIREATLNVWSWETIKTHNSFVDTKLEQQSMKFA